jgi:hypothetical protein
LSKQWNPFFTYSVFYLPLAIFLLFNLFIKNKIFDKYKQVYFSFCTLHDISALNGLLCLRFSVHLGDETLVVLLLSLSYLTFRAAVTTFLLSKETTFGGLPVF